MSYTHVKVRDALTHNGIEADTTELLEFKSDVSKALRGYKFHPRNNNSLYVYRDDCPYVLGWIGYGDYRRGGDGSRMYCVKSRTITNNKYADYNDQHNMAMSVNMQTALRNAKKHLRPYSPRELALLHTENVSRSIGNVSDDARRKVSDLHQKVIDVDKYRAYDISGNLMAELRHLLQTGHEFVTDGFADNLRTFFEAVVEHNQVNNREIPMYFVRVYERFGQQAFDVVHIPNATQWRPTITDDVFRYTETDLPEDIMGKLSVLNILADEEFVDDVGYKAGDGMFYVTV